MLRFSSISCSCTNKRFFRRSSIKHCPLGRGLAISISQVTFLKCHTRRSRVRREDDRLLHNRFAVSLILEAKYGIIICIHKREPLWFSFFCPQPGSMVFHTIAVFCTFVPHHCIQIGG